ncbi:hemerythrin domain-containing protein [Sphingomonas sp.]|jgi:hemerythrin superfamily protein|uniref:hemerythrin domain-containing protein n=1 Tax=Sphingomonas sp. TaxID=28214 RepID=UPI002DB8D610|nr:hemerythrin domain-containing protein [Sphingomonas sp.]HEU4969011.1 hemerythrin domain-containing protein [Sphingomonas sp.]
MATEAASKSTRSRSKNGENGKGGGSTGALIGAAAAGVAVGLMANLGRKAAVQAPTMMAGDWDQALAAEHAATMKLFDAMQATTDKNTTKRSMLLMQLKHALAKHAIEEENAVYPCLRDSGQTEEADHLNHDHGYVKQFLYDLDNMPKDSPAFMTKVGEFRSAVEEHVREEEDKIFPKLKAKLSPEQNKALTAAMNKEGFKLA